MAGQPHVPTSGDAGGAQTPPAAATYGYRRPPKKMTWKGGQSGNPKGRPRGQRNWRTVVNAELNKRIRLREGTRSRTVSKREAIIIRMVNDSVNGSAKAQVTLLTLMRSLGLIAEVPEGANREPITANDQALIRDFLMRRAAELSLEDKGPEVEKDPAQAPTEKTAPAKARKS